MFNDFYEININSPADSARYMITSRYDIIERADFISSFLDINYNRLFVNYLEELDSSCKYIAVGSCFKIAQRGTVHLPSFLLKVGRKYYVRVEKPCIYI